MGFGEYLRHLRKVKGLTQKQLADLAGFSNTEISRIESGDRRKPSPIILKAIAPHLSVPYEELLKQAGYLEEVIDHRGYTEHVFMDEDGRLTDIVRKAKEMQEADSDWASIAYRVSKELPREDLEAIKAIAQSLLNRQGSKNGK
ncbi:MAG TPA: helix-turn-helix transcriptional regulator [Candidatus Atribacteria bacterium]|nr:helix-turn-helix transcriptional regulator [Candidatus Atribacteria bacterium]HPT77519.1 helix-turn-helix transcriptional regulator [Candidatus Atribacteria bacterium]